MLQESLWFPLIYEQNDCRKQFEWYHPLGIFIQLFKQIDKIWIFVCLAYYGNIGSKQ